VLSHKSFERRELEGLLLFEEVFEGLAGVERARRSGLGSSGLCGLRVARRGGVFFNRHAKFVESASVLRVFRRDTFWDGLRAFKLRAGVEEAALLAAVKLEIALGTLAVGIESGGENGAAVGAARAGDRPDHARSARAEVIVLAARSALRGLSFLAMFLFVLLFVIAVAAMTILTVHVRLRITVRAGGNSQSSSYWANATHPG